MSSLQQAAGAGFMPHGYCFLWKPGLIWFHVVSDGLIAAAYFTIPFVLLYFIRQRRDLPFSWMFVCFGVFILACGATHLMSVYTIWHPAWWASGGIKAVTALASVPTAILLARLVPDAVALPSPRELRAANAALAEQVAERERAEMALRSAHAALQQMHDELEQRVEARTRELREVEAQLLQAQKMEAIGRLAGGIAHDFNNLLTVINGVSSMVLEDCPADAPFRSELAEINQAGERAAALTSQLLAFSRRQVLHPQALDLNAVVADLQRMLARLIGDDIAIRLALEPTLGVTQADRSQIEQVIVNLAVNARDAMPEGGTLTIETANVYLSGDFGSERLALDPGSYVMLAVCDTGVGMDAVTQAHVFEPFFTTKAQGKGTGLGLSTVYGIVKQSGGAIYVYSEPGHGSAFKVYLPRSTATITPTAERTPAEPASGHECVLVVEDEPGVRHFVARILRKRGYRVLEAASGNEALELAASAPIDLLVTDVVMPGINGPALAKRLIAARPDVGVIYMSGYTDARLQPGVLDSGVAFIQKPFTPQGLVQKVREVLDAGTKHRGH